MLGVKLQLIPGNKGTLTYHGRPNTSPREISMITLNIRMKSYASKKGLYPKLLKELKGSSEPSFGVVYSISTIIPRTMDGWKTKRIST